MKILIDKNNEISEVFEISNYYFEKEGQYLEAGFGSDVDPMNREIILQQNNYMDETNEWDEISIISDSGIDLLKITNKNGATI